MTSFQQNVLAPHSPCESTKINAPLKSRGLTVRILFLALLFFGCTQNSRETKTVECEARSEAACEGDRSCMAIKGENSLTQKHEFAGCATRVIACGLSITCAVSPKSKIKYSFSDTCIPDGFVSVQCKESSRSQECIKRSEEACTLDTECSKQEALNTMTQTREYVGCTAPSQKCDDAITCAISSKTKNIYSFPSSCIPDDFTVTECPANLVYRECKERLPGTCDTDGKCGDMKAVNTMTQKEEIVGCLSLHQECGASETCAVSPKNQNIYFFTSTCIPDGFQPRVCPPL